MRKRAPRLIPILVLILLAGLLRVYSANPAIAQTRAVGAWRVASEPVMDGFAPEWQSIVPAFLPTTAQQVTPPIGGGTVERIAVRAVHWEDRLYVMVEWADPTNDSSTGGHEAFADAAAIQFPAEAGSEVPFLCMGQADQAVNIWQWRSDHQQEIPGLPESGYVDLYPSTDDLYFTAREAGNPISQTDRAPVQNLVAGGFGTLEVTDTGALQGHGSYQEGRWTVVFARPFLPSGDLQPEFDGSIPIDIAFAVWDGSKEERDGLKSVSAFIQLQVSPEGPTRRPVAASGDWPAFTPANPELWMYLAFVVLVVAMAIGVSFYVTRGPKEEHVNDD